MSEADNVSHDSIESCESPMIFIPQDVRGTVPEAKKKRRRRRRRTNWPLVFVILALFAAWLVHVLVVPELQIRYWKLASPKKFLPPELEMQFSTRVVLRTCEFLFVYWFFYLGASIGSFINVVADRVPRGLTIVSEGSRCPFCFHRLNFFENMPVFGWIRLRGRCKACRIPIAPRYLIIEIIVGTIFMAFSIIELIHNGENLPLNSTWRFGQGIVETVFFPKKDLIAGYAVHCACFAVIVMLIASHMDRFRFPEVPVMVLGGMLIIAQAAFPALVSVYWNEPFAAHMSPSTLEARVWSSLLGGAVGILLGLIAVPLIRWPISSPDATSEPVNPSALIHHAPMMFGLSGALFGWQCVVLVTLVSLGIFLLAAASTRMATWNWPVKAVDLRYEVIALSIWTSTLLVHHAFWRQIATGLGFH